MIHLFKNKKRIVTAFALLAFVFSLITPFTAVKAQMFVSDPAGLTQALTKYFSDLGSQVEEKTKSYADDLLDNLVATIYKQGVGTILNVLAAETARSIATGDFGSPLFTDTKGFFNTLADGVVGDVLNDIVNGAIGIDLCNINPEYTLGLALALPLFDEYKYSPKCSLTQIADQIEAIDLKNIVKFDIQISGTSSWTDFFEQFKRDPVSAPTGLALAVRGLDEIYGKSDSELNNMISTDKEEIDQLVEALKSTTGDGDRTLDLDSETNGFKFKTSDDVKNRLDEYRCKIAYDLQRFNLGVYRQADFSNSEYTGMSTNKACKDFDFNQGDLAVVTGIPTWLNKAREASTGWVSTTIPDNELKTILKTISDKMDGQAARETNPIKKGVARVEYLYNTCRQALDNALNVKLTTNTSSGTVSGALPLGEKTVITSIPPSPRTYPDLASRESIAFNIAPYVGSTNAPVLLINTDVTPSCDTETLDKDTTKSLALEIESDGTFRTQTTFANIFEKASAGDSDFEAIACYAISATGEVNPENNSEVFTFNFPIASDLATSTPTTPPTSNTFTADVPIIGSNDFTTSTLSYTQVKKLDQVDYVTCQLAYNHGTLLRAYWQDDTGVVGGQFGFRKGPNKFPDGESLSPRDRGQLVPEKIDAVNDAVSQNEVYVEVPLGIYAVFHPDILLSGNFQTIYTPVDKNIPTPPKNPEEFFAGFIRTTIMADAAKTGLGESWRKAIFSGISNGHSLFRGSSEIVLKKLTDIEGKYTKLSEKLSKARGEVGLSTAERKKELDKASRQEAPLNAAGQITKAALNAKERKKEEELANKQIEGTLSNAPRSGVSDLALAIPEVQNERLAALISGDSGKFGDYTGQIIADGANVFLSTLWNNLLIRGLSALNPLLAEQNIVNVGLDSEIERRAAEQELCQSDPANCPASALVKEGQFDTVNPPCDNADLNLLLALNRLGKSLGSIASSELSGSATSGDLSPGCKAACDELCQGDPGLCSVGACANAIKKGATAEDAGNSKDDRPGERVDTGEKITGGVLKDIENVITVANRQESKTGITAFKSVFDDPENLVGFDLTSNIAQLDLLKDLQTCPKSGGQSNPSLYNCTLTAKIVTVLKNKFTLRQILDKKHISETSAIGVNNKGEVPSLESGFSLASIQKMRKLRIMPLGLEFAARLKIACYQAKYPTTSTYPYKNISDECVFYDKDGNEISVGPTFDSLRDEVIAANFKTILDGFNDTDSAGDCVYLNGDANQASPFCGLVNPDWVVKLPTPSCEEYAPGQILVNGKSSNRYTQCNDVVSEVSAGNYGYCVKERNIWEISGQKCDAQYSTCTAYVLKDGTIASFNKDSLLGAGVCSADNAGCVWFSTIRQGLTWVDSATKTNRESCLAIGAVWDGLKCVSSRIYINDNVESCPATDKGCTELKLVKQDGNNIIMDGGFEYSQDEDIHPFWKISKTEKITDTYNVTSCVENGGFVSSVCTNINYNDFGTCTSQGGTFDFENNTCSDAILTGVTQNKCGVCKFNGSDLTKDSSNLLLDSVSCDANVASGHIWEPGDYAELCSLPDAECAENIGTCLLDYRDYNIKPDECELYKGIYHEGLCTKDSLLQININASTECEAIGGDWSDAKSCLSASGQVTVLKGGDYENNPTLCRSIGAQFISSCPFKVTNQEAFGGQKSLSLNLGLNYNPLVDVDQEMVISYPIVGDDLSSMIIAGDTYSVQFVAKLNSTDPDLDELKGRAELIKTYNSGRIDKKTIAITLSKNYQEFSTSLTSITSGTDLELRLIFPKTQDANISLDNVKLEFNSPSQILSGGEFVGSYSEYSDNAGLYVKTPPDYLQCNGYSNTNPSPAVNTYNLQVTCQNAGLYWDADLAYGSPARCYRYEPDHQRCREYAQVCRNEEAGCQLYTPTNGEPAVPGVLGQNDYCPAECDGYETFKQQASYFEPAGVAPIEYFIPKTATQCNAKDVGCDAFTNTSISATTGNPVEYYTYLRQCVVPNTAQGEAGFFIWQGSTNGTPQLKTFNLQADDGTCSNASFNNDPEACLLNNNTYTYSNSGLGGPRVTSVDGYCTEDDLGRDLDCLKFYDSAGNEYLRKLSYTIEVTSECVTLRKSNSDQVSCVKTNGQWVNNECLYKALPSQSQQCQAAVSGCREYVGNTGNNFTPVVFDNFENVTSTQWSVGETDSSTKPILSSEAVTTLGKSLEVVQGNSSISRAASITTGKSYVLSFWAKTRDGDSRNLGARFSSGDSAQVFADPQTSVIRIGSEWSKVEVGPVYVDWAETSANRLIIENTGGIYIDNILLTQLKDSVYVVRNSWKTPDSCNMTNLGASIAQAQLGCQEYKTSSEQKLFIKSFAKLCRESSVGCTLVQNTRNSRTPLQQIFNNDNNTKIDDVTVFADRLMALVITKDVLCKTTSRGCSEVGIVQEVLPTAKEGITLTIKNDPDKYQTGVSPIMCNQESLGCVELKNFKGEQDYRKINFSETCSYSESKNGFVKDDGSGLGCSASAYTNQTECKRSGGAWNAIHSQCTSSIPGIGFANCTLPSFTNEYLRRLRESCITDYDGSWYYDGSQGCGCARNPYQYYKVNEYPEHQVLAASCPVKQDQCTEYLDFNPNYVLNGDFEDVVDGQIVKAKNWDDSNDVETGYQVSQQGETKSGTKAIRLVKNTTKDLPGAGGNQGIALKDTPFYVSQTLSRLEKGKTYELNMDVYFNPALGLGALGAGDEGFCKPVDIAYEIVPFYSENLKSVLPESVTDATNRLRILTVETSAGWKKVSSKFIVPQNGFPIPIPTTEVGETNRSNYCVQNLGGFYSSTPLEVGDYKTSTSCTAAKFTWVDEPAGSDKLDRCVASCFLGDPSEVTTNMEIRLYSPLNGSCLNKRTGERRFFLADGRPFDQYTCQGATSDVFANIPLRVFQDPTFIEGYYSGYESRELIRDVVVTEIVNGVSVTQSVKKIVGILDADDSSALGQGDEWEWQGNCEQSSVVIDRLQISPERESLYHFINKGNLDTKSCNGSVNWDAGCIQFENISTEQNEVIKVKPDRECSDWLYCKSRDEKGACLSWTTCSQQEGDECIRFGSKADELRYQTDDTGKLKSITLSNYQRRLSNDGLRMSNWRAGDYAGYTIPNLPPLEQIYNIVPASYRHSLTPADPDYGDGYHFKEADPLPEFGTSAQIVDDNTLLSHSREVGDGVLYIECKNFPETTSPFITTLKNLVPGFEGVNTINDYTNVDDRLAGCRYVKYNLKGEEVYYKDAPIEGKFEVCTNETTRGKRCVDDAECGASGVGSCLDVASVLATTETDTPIGLTKVAIGQKAYQGTVGICVEEDSLIKVTGGLFDSNSNGKIDEKDEELNQNDLDLQNACLTFIPD